MSPVIHFSFKEVFLSQHFLGREYSLWLICVDILIKHMVLKAAVGARLCSVHVPMAQWSGASRHVPSLALVCVPHEL